MSLFILPKGERGSSNNHTPESQIGSAPGLALRLIVGFQFRQEKNGEGEYRFKSRNGAE